MTKSAPAALALLLLPLAGCPAEEEAGPTGPLVYEEDDDRGNYRRSFAEDIDDDWGTQLQIVGSMEGCGAEEGDWDWDYTEDMDYYRFEVGSDGWLEVSLDWEGGSDLDLVVRTNDRDRTMLDDLDDQPVEYARDDRHDDGDSINIGIFCKTGDATDYTVTVDLELD